MIRCAFKKYPSRSSVESESQGVKSGSPATSHGGTALCRREVMAWTRMVAKGEK